MFSHENYKIATPEQAMAMKASYAEKVSVFARHRAEKKRLADLPYFIHRIYQGIELPFAVSVYIPISFNNKYHFEEQEKYDIHTLVAYAYETRPTFQKFVDDNVDFETDTIRVITGFHESLIDGKLATYFNIAFAHKVLHFMLDWHFNKTYIREISMKVDM
jgi:hypothetical protein